MRLGISGSILCCLSVVNGAFGAHALKGILSENGISWWETGTTYLWYHGLAMLALHSFPTSVAMIARRWLVPGVCIFSGSLYLYAFTQWRSFGMITPIGGTLLVIGWLRIVLTLRNRDTSSEKEHID